MSVDQEAIFMWPKSATAAHRSFARAGRESGPSGRQTCLRGVEIACASQLGFGHLQTQKTAPRKKREEFGTRKIPRSRLRRPSKPDEHFYNLQGRFFPYHE